MRRFSCLLIVLLVACEVSVAAEVRILPAEIRLNQLAQSQSISVGLFDGETFVKDLTDKAELTISDPSKVVLGKDFRVSAKADGEAFLTAKTSLGVARTSVKVSGAAQEGKVSFVNEVIPILTRAGCNSGACHGALAGKGGLKLSLRGYDSLSDHFAISRQNLSRRLNWAKPEDSLLLAKASGVMTHGGGRKLAQDHPDYAILKSWIAQGAPMSIPNEPQVLGLKTFPAKLRLKQGDKARVLAMAIMSDGSQKDVSQWVRFSSSEEQAAPVDQDGWVTASGFGEAGIIAIFSNQVATSTVTSPFDNQVDSGVYSVSPRNNFIDNLVLDKLRSLNLPPSNLCSDEDFIRRVYLDMAGILPTTAEVTEFTRDTSPQKREKLVDRLLIRPETTDYWAYKWSDMFLISTRNLGQPSVWSFYQFVRKSVADNTPWDVFARSMLTVRGNTLSKGAANYFVLHKDVTDLTETTAVTFLGMSLTCARCHNHPLEKWTQDQYWAMASLFGKVAIKNGENTGEFLVETVPVGEVLHPKRGLPMPAAPLDFQPMAANSPDDPREYFANWLTGKENPFFARAIVNRVWKNYLGRGLFESEDDLRASNPPSNQELLDALAGYFVREAYDMRKLMRLIVLSATYQRSSQPKPGNELDEKYYSRFYPRRLKAEILLDACSQVTGVPTNFNQVNSRGGDAKTNYNGYPKGLRAMQLPDASVTSRFLDAFGRPERAQACSCERQTDSSVGQALHVFNGNTVNEKLRSEEFVGVKWIKDGTQPSEMVNTIFMRALARKPTEKELAKFAEVIQQAGSLGDKARREALEDVCWSILTSREFVFNH